MPRLLTKQLLVTDQGQLVKLKLKEAKLAKILYGKGLEKKGY